MDKAHIFHEFSIGLNDILDAISDGILYLTGTAHLYSSTK